MLIKSQFLLIQYFLILSTKMVANKLLGQKKSETSPKKLNFDSIVIFFETSKQRYIDKVSKNIQKNQCIDV
jgi:hypothetical protein